MAHRTGMLWLLSLWLGSCTLLPPTPALPTPVRPPDITSAAEALQAAVEGDYPLDALTIRYQVGSEAWEGSTTLVVHGRGAAEVAFNQTGQHQGWQAQLSEEEVLALVRLLVDHELWAIRGRRDTGLPDEALPTVTVEAEGFEPLRITLWANEAAEHPDFSAIIQVLHGLARQISGGGAK
ncbi:MAG: hypothetical protein PVJ34_06560 [Anaerolineae bacterium]